MQKRLIEIICEIGINWNGNMLLFEKMVKEAKECGADTIKTQLYDPIKLLNPKDFSDSDWIAIRASELSPENLFFIKELCDELEIDLLFSVFDLERLEWLEKLGMERYKIASRSVFDEELWKAIIDTGKGVLVSDGCLLDHNLNSRPPLFPGAFDRVEWLYCISNYPTQLSDLSFYAFDYLDVESGNYDIADCERCSIWNVGEYIGFSDHTIGISAALFAMANGARIIEKHFTLDKSMPGPDHCCSATPEELRRLCEHRDDFEKILGEA